MNKQKAIIYADDDYESIAALFKLRAPSLAIGLILGTLISFVVSRFEDVLNYNVQVAFFMPFIVYIADAIGTQTETIYSRNLKSGRVKFTNYLRKELVLGAVFGLLFGAFAGLVIFLWLKSNLLAASVAIATFFAVAAAPLVNLVIAQIFQSIHKDPAVETAPIATVVQDAISVVIYGLVCSMIIL